MMFRKDDSNAKSVLWLHFMQDMTLSFSKINNSMVQKRMGMVNFGQQQLLPEGMIWAVLWGIFPSIALKSVAHAVLIREIKYLLLGVNFTPISQDILLCFL